MKKILCPSCGHETQINDEKPFSFCTECGNKITLQPQPNIANEARQDEILYNNNEISKKLEEADFYYKLSFEKKEYENDTDNPTYYLKAQDLLLDLSEQYPDDYRIWWELCKPVDYMCASFETDAHDQYQINEDYFNKALDRAELPKKRELIDKHDKYVNRKAKSAVLAKKKLAEKEKIRIEKEAAKKREHEEKCERERIQRQREEEKLQKQAEIARKANRAINEPLWHALANKDYSMLDNKFFEFTQENNQTIIAVFRHISNMLYLNSFRIDGNKGNTLYQDQSFAVQFNNEGYGVKFDNTPIKIKGFMPPENILHVTKANEETIYVNNILLKSDKQYIANIMKSAKRPLFSFSKAFQ